jgi:hypothetical protein
MTKTVWGIIGSLLLVAILVWCLFFVNPFAKKADKAVDTKAIVPVVVVESKPIDLSSVKIPTNSDKDIEFLVKVHPHRHQVCHRQEALPTIVPMLAMHGTRIVNNTDTTVRVYQWDIKINDVNDKLKGCKLVFELSPGANHTFYTRYTGLFLKVVVPGCWGDDVRTVPHQFFGGDSNKVYEEVIK